MSAALLRTKLFVPPPRHSLVGRPRVTEKLNAGLNGKFTLVSAPAGFGKSTALSTWAATSSQPVAWLSLDEADNDPVRFWTYLAAALETLIPDVGDIGDFDALEFETDLVKPSHWESMVVNLINSIAATQESRLSLVLDDYHVISEPQVNDAFFFFLDRLPHQLHMTLAGRTDPPWPLARLRARGELTEVRTSDLRFTTEETAVFLRDIMGLRLTPEEIDALEERTEGWIAGLQMAALSMRGREDLSGLIDALSGSHRFIMDYLLQEVLDKQTQGTRDFLLQTSVLERLTPSLCNAVTQRDDGEQMLTYLEQANLFLIPQDDLRRWYRYHHLFADLLISRQQRMQPDQTPALHRRASEWFESKGQLGEAMTHASAAGDADRQVRLLADNVLTMAYQGELALLVKWLDQLPTESGHHQPWFHISHAWVLVFAGHLDQVEPHLHDAEDALAGKPGDHADREHDRIVGHIAALRGYVAGLQGEWQRSYEHATEALDRLPDKNAVERGWTILLLAVVLRAFGRLTEADQAFVEADAISRSVGYVPLTVDILWERSELQRTQGKLQAAYDNCRDVLQLAEDYHRRTGRRLSPTGYTYAGMAAVLRERNDLEGALKSAAEGVVLCRRWGMADAIVRSHMQLSWTYQAAGNPDEARRAMDEARRVAGSMSPMYRDYVGTATARLHLTQAKLDAVADWANTRGLRVDDDFDFGQIEPYTIFARLLVQQVIRRGHGSFREALGLLDRLQELATTSGATGNLIEVLVLKALALFGDGHEAEALEILAQALHHAEPETYVRSFVDLGTSMSTLLQRALLRDIAPGYVRQLLSILEGEQNAGRPVNSFEALTERELEVLRLLPTRLSTVEIADRLVVAPSTVRTHVKSIYSKLQVNRRMDAVQRAIDLQLI